MTQALQGKQRQITLDDEIGYQVLNSRDAMKEQGYFQSLFAQASDLQQ